MKNCYTLPVLSPWQFCLCACDVRSSISRGLIPQQQFSETQKKCRRFHRQQAACRRPRPQVSAPQCSKDATHSQCVCCAVTAMENFTLRSNARKLKDGKWRKWASVSPVNWLLSSSRREGGRQAGFTSVTASFIWRRKIQAHIKDDSRSEKAEAVFPF